ncbi:hypothetical protein [Nitrincola iocasae]|uniref:Apea-like HEPN domain-containing protein n=1 Tax=Nitrincola iocasae TaxID=2614693 RepID=A0A5J6LF23_9GAMM|nr:hypothetical protein [Nitrincola iocasae]QEW07135.1 hypothetical protein F5I99_11795 [Nitrincola iocasae]
MADLRAQLINYLGCGHEITRYGNKVIRDTLNFECDSVRVKIVQREDVITNPHSIPFGQLIVTSSAIISNVRKEDVTSMLDILDRICWLLSFAGLSMVGRVGYEYPDGSGLGSSHAAIGEANFFRPTIDIADGKDVVGFINDCYEKYKLLESCRNLRVVIHYLVEAERRRQPLELKLIIAFTILESLKDTFARTEGIPYVNGFFRKVPKPTKGRDSFSFGELLSMMFTRSGMKTELKQVTALRNEIIHSGISRKSYSWKSEMYDYIHDLIREYLLRLLGYRGNYLTYSSGSNERRRL